MPEAPTGPGRLAFFVPTLRYGGVERVVLNLARGFAERGHAVDLVAADGRGEFAGLAPPSVRVVDLGARRVLTSLPSLVRYLRRARPQAVIAAMEHCSLVALWARRWARVSTRVVATTHSPLSLVTGPATRWRERSLPFLARRYYGRADGVVAVSAGVAKDLARALGWPGERIRVIYNPVLTPEFAEHVRRPVEHPWFTPGQPPVVLSVGRLVPAKDHATLLYAFARVRRRRSARLVIIGEGEERPRLEGLIRELGLGADTALLGYLPDPYAHMARAAVFVLSSRWEGLGLVLVEALAAGTRVVSTDCPSGPREVLCGGCYGRLVPVGDAQAMAVAIERALMEPPPVLPREALQPYTLEAAVAAYAEVIGI